MSKIVHKRGTTFRRAYSWLDDNDQPIDLTGGSVASSWRQAGGTTEIALTVEILDAETGQFRVSLDPEDTADLDPGAYVWDIVASVGGDVIATENVEIDLIAGPTLG